MTGTPDQTFVMEYRDELDRIAKRWGLSDAEYRALHWFTMQAGYRTGDIRGTTRKDIADRFGWSKHKTIRVMDRLAECGLILAVFTRGHEGWIAVMAYPDLVRAKSAKIAAQVEANLKARSFQKQTSGPPADARPLVPNRNERGAKPERAESCPLVPDRNERTGETLVSVGSRRGGRPSFLYGVAVGVEDSSLPRSGKGRGEANVTAGKSYLKRDLCGREVGASACASRAYLSGSGCVETAL